MVPASTLGIRLYRTPWFCHSFHAFVSGCLWGGEEQLSARWRGQQWNIWYAHIGSGLLSPLVSSQYTEACTSQDCATSVRDHPLSRNTVRSFLAWSSSWNRHHLRLKHSACSLCTGTASPPLPPSASRPQLTDRTQLFIFRPSPLDSWLSALWIVHICQLMWRRACSRHTAQILQKKVLPSSYWRARTSVSLVLGLMCLGEGG